MSNNKTKAKLIIFSAPSGAGKSSLIKEVISRSSGNIQLSISATTRPPRDGEEHGRDYFFISDEEFNDIMNRRPKRHDHYSTNWTNNKIFQLFKKSIIYLI